MNTQRNYIHHVLSEAHMQVRRRCGDVAAMNVEKVVNKISQSDDMRKTLRSLYRVSGFDLVALRLLWLMEFVGVEGRAPNDSVTAHEVRTLVGYLAPLCETHTQKKA